MNVTDVAHRTVHSYPGGCDVLAFRLHEAGLTKMSGAVLRGKVNPENGRNKLTLDEAMTIVDFTGDDRILRAWALHRGKALVDIDQREEPAKPVFAHLLDMQVREGHFSQILQDALADGVISTNEMKAISDASLGVQGALINLVSRLVAEHRARAIP